MFKIRQGCFETNSSSTHAIIVAAEKVEPLYFSVKFDIGEFGWEHDVLDSPDEKASYLYTAACELSDHDVYDELVEKLAPYGVSCYSTNRAQFKEYEGHKYLDNGYVDHSDECREFVDYMMADPERLVSFLFSDKSYVVTANDNCDDIDELWYEGKIHKADEYDHKIFYKGN